MDPRFTFHNKHLAEGLDGFMRHDPQLEQLAEQVYQYQSYLILCLPVEIPGIYTLSGGRQIGKSTLLKQWMLHLLQSGVPPKAIAFLSGELIDDHQSLWQLLQTQLQDMPANQLRYLIIDEITYIRDWDKTVKYAADSGLLRQVILLITGSDLRLIRDARLRFPGRRGKADCVDFHLDPLSFYEYVKLTKVTPKLALLADPDYSASSDEIAMLYPAFDAYLQHGGFLTAINDVAATGAIQSNTLQTYADWIRGDIIKQGKQDHYLREIIIAIIKRYNSQVSWNALARDLSIDHPNTVADYAATLVAMDVLVIQPALLEDKLVAAPKKNKKLLFRDPFIFHALQDWLQMPPLNNDPNITSKLVEACVSAHFARYYPTYYIKAAGEVDIAYVDQQRFWPVEIKWSQQLRSGDLKQIAKYDNALIYCKSHEYHQINGVQAIPLPLALLWLNHDRLVRRVGWG